MIVNSSAFSIWLENSSFPTSSHEQKNMKKHKNVYPPWSSMVIKHKDDTSLSDKSHFPTLEESTFLIVLSHVTGRIFFFYVAIFHLDQEAVEAGTWG